MGHCRSVVVKKGGADILLPALEQKALAWVMDPIRRSRHMASFSLVPHAAFLLGLLLVVRSMTLIFA